MTFHPYSLNNIAEIAARAGAAILALGPGAVAIKADGSPVTQADLAANELICAELAVQFPDYQVVCEETVRTYAVNDSRFVFLVDPLDGTKEYLRGSGEFTVNIALLDGPDPVAGVICAPALGKIFAGGAGIAARSAPVLAGKIGAWTAIRAIEPSRALRAVISYSHATPATRQFLDDYVIVNTQAVGSSLKFCMIASGEADIYPRIGQTMGWDTAAGDAILRAAGGRVLTLDGRPLQYLTFADGGARKLENPSFVAAGAFDPFDLRWRALADK